MQAVIKYPGAKWATADWIISHFPAHRHYVEPYFGSGAVLFNKPPADHEIINDLSGDVANLFRVMREHGEDLARLIELTPWARDEYDLSCQTAGEPLERARRFVVNSWQSYARGIPGVKTGWKTGGIGSDASQGTVMRWSHIPDRIRTVMERLRFVEIDNRPAVDVIARHKSVGVLIYADPPYVGGIRRRGFYPLEMSDADHIELLDTLDRHPGPVVLSGYHCQLYDDRLRHWQTRRKRVAVEKGQMRIEILWLNKVCTDRLGFGPLFEIAS